MIKPTFLRRVAIAALFTGSCFSTVAAPPAPSPVSYGVEEDVFHPVRAKQGWWRLSMPLPPKWG